VGRGIDRDQTLQKGQGDYGEGEKEEKEAGREKEKSPGSRREAHKIDAKMTVVGGASFWRDLDKPTSI
jgi:hypothetical protein